MAEQHNPNAKNELERFQADAAKYAGYLDTPEGRLRIDLALANLQEFLPREPQSLRALDLGGGTGAVSVRLAGLGFHVTLLDGSVPMLEFAERAARGACVSERIVLKQGDAGELTSLFETGALGAGFFDVIVCHNVLEFVDDPGAVLRSAARTLRDPCGVLSVLVRTQAGEVLKAALQEGDLAAAEQSLNAECGNESLYGGRVRLFTGECLQEMMRQSSLEVVAERGVRVVADYLPPRISRLDEYERIFELERKLGRRPEFAGVARYRQCVARRHDAVLANPVMKDAS